MLEVKRVGSLLTLSLLVIGSAAPAEEKAGPTTRGTVERVEKSRLVVKAADGKAATFTLDAKTVVLRGDKAAPASSLKVGEPVAIEYRAAGGVSLAVKVRVGEPPAAARYLCPMHPEVVSAGPGKCPKCGMFLEQAKP